MWGIATAVLPNRPADIDAGGSGGAGKWLARKLTLQSDRNWTPQVCNISDDILLAIYRINFNVIYRS